jgi:hypothetical protein
MYDGGNTTVWIDLPGSTLQYQQSTRDPELMCLHLPLETTALSAPVY